METMSSLDGAFLHLESKDSPLHIGSLFLIEKPKDNEIPFFQIFKEVIVPRIEAEPLLRRRLAAIPFNLSNPVWIEGDIDINYHIRHIYLPYPGTQKQLEDCIAELHSTRLDRQYPLWEIVVIEGLESGKIGLYTKVHHALLDGISAIYLAASLLDNRHIDTTSLDEFLRESEKPSRLELLLAALRQNITQSKMLISKIPQILNYCLSEFKIKKGLFSKLKDTSVFAPKTIFNNNITHERTYTSVSLDLDSIRSIAKKHHVTINDVLLSICSGALRSYLEKVDNLPNKSLVAVVPVSWRKPKNKNYNNQANLSYVNLATDVANPSLRLQTIHDTINSMKRSAIKNKDHLNLANDLPSFGLTWILCGYISLIEKTKLADHLPPFANLLITHIPGPRHPISIAGYKIESCIPISIVRHGMSLNITMMSYCDSIDIGIIAAKNVIDDSNKIAICIKQAFEELKKGVEDL